MRIGELAGLVGISTRAIRHYHQVGLLAEPTRLPNGYREYSLRDAVELARVRRLTELGLNLDEVGAILAGDAGRDLTEILRELDADLGRQGGSYSIVVLTQDNPTMAYGIATIQTIARAINHDLHAAAG